MKTLYVSDLDGTLLNDHTAIDQEPLATLNSLLDDGLLFSVATGRSLTVARHILAPMHLTLPTLLLNGVHGYDWQRQKTVYVHQMDKALLREMTALLNDESFCSVYYVMRPDGDVQLYYQNDNTPLTHAYLKSRQSAFVRYCNYEAILPKRFSDVVATEQICFLIIMGQSEEKLLALKKTLDTFSHLTCHLYKENGTGFISLEVFSNKGGKDNGISFLKEESGAKEVVSFGDNLNDLAMKKQSNLFCAVQNALPELKKHADVILHGDNNGASVIQFISDRQKL